MVEARNMVITWRWNLALGFLDQITIAASRSAAANLQN